MQNQLKISFIGGGNMATHLIAGMVKARFQPTQITVADPSVEKLKSLESKFKINATADNLQAISNADLIVFAVKPQMLHAVIEPLKNKILETKPLIISIAAGITYEQLSTWLENNARIVRTMPNLPVSIGEGMTALFSPKISKEEKKQADSIFSAAGKTLWIDDENMMDSIASLSGCGPAMIFLVIEAMQSAGEALGLSTEQAKTLTLQTVFGAAKMALASPLSATELRQQVTSPKGMTEQAIEQLQSGDLNNLFKSALKAAVKRAKELSDENR